MSFRLFGRNLVRALFGVALLGVSGVAHAQSGQSGGMVNMIDADQIGKLITQYGADLPDDEKGILEFVGRKVEELVARGELNISEEGVEELTAEIADFLKNPVYEGPNVIENTQTSLERGEVYWIAQTGVGFSWRKSRPCTRAGEVMLTLVGFEPICVVEGQPITVPYEDGSVEVIYQGRTVGKESSERTFVVRAGD